MKISTAARNGACNYIVDSIDAGGGAGYMQIRTGSQPANPAASNTGTLLATLTFSATAFGSASTGVATANSITSDTNIDATGTAAHFRVFDFANTCIFQGTVTATGGGGDCTFNTTSFVSGGTCAMTSGTVTVPE